MNSSKPSISCLSYNIHKGFSASNSDYLLAEMRDAIRATNTDIVAIQEILGEHLGHAKAQPNWHDQAQFEFLADSVWRSYAYGKNAIYQEGHHGNALLSKFPFLEYANHDITQWRFSQRGLLHGVVNWPPESHRKLNIACVHLGFLPIEQWRQTRKIASWVSKIPDDEPLILMGDFNDWHHRIHRRLINDSKLKEAGTEHFGRPIASFPANKPKLALDRIYYRGLKLVKCEVQQGEVWSQLSDHCPISANFLLEN